MTAISPLYYQAEAFVLRYGNSALAHYLQVIHHAERIDSYIDCVHVVEYILQILSDQGRAEGEIE